MYRALDHSLNKNIVYCLEMSTHKDKSIYRFEVEDMTYCYRDMYNMSFWNKYRNAK